LEAAGLPLERCYASYDLDEAPAEGDSASLVTDGERLIVVARKPDSAAGGRAPEETA